MLPKLGGVVVGVRSASMLEQQLLLMLATLTGVVVGFTLSWMAPASSPRPGHLVYHSDPHTAAHELPAPSTLAPQLLPRIPFGVPQCSPTGWRKYGHYSGPCDVCDLTPAALLAVLGVPHDCKSDGFWNGTWQAIGLLQRQPKGEALCLILCATHIPCSEPPCVLGIHARPGGSDGLVVRDIFFHGMFTKNITLQSADAILDAGANIGAAAIFFSMKFPNAAVVSVEASKHNFGLLKLNTRNLPRVVPVHAALWSTVVDLCLFVGNRRTHRNPEWGYRVYPCKLVPRSIQVLEKMQGITIPVLSRMFDIPHFDILKIDIEGAEGTVFHSGSDTSFLKHAQLAIVEVHNSLWKKCGRIVSSAFNRTQRWLPSQKIGEHHVWVAVPSVSSARSVSLPRLAP